VFVGNLEGVNDFIFHNASTLYNFFFVNQILVKYSVYKTSVNWILWHNDVDEHLSLLGCYAMSTFNYLRNFQRTIFPLHAVRTRMTTKVNHCAFSKLHQLFSRLHVVTSQNTWIFIKCFCVLKNWNLKPRGLSRYPKTIGYYL
jgi:hypothetical protein